MEAFSAIPVFIAVVEGGSFSAAALTLGVSKSAVSKRITLLEQRLGVKLLHRTTRRLSLTEAGERYYQHASIAQSAASEAEDAVTQLQSEPKGRLRINVPMSFGRMFVAPMVPHFLKRYPKIQLDMVMDDRVMDLVENGFDLAIRAGDLPDSTLVSRKLAITQSVLCASPEYLSQHGKPAEPEELTGHNCLLYSYSSDSNGWTLVGAQEQFNIPVSGNYQVNNSEALCEALLQGIGIGRLPSFVAGPEIRAGRLHQVLPDWTVMPQATIYALFPQRQYLPAKVRVFLDFCLEYFATAQQEWAFE